MVADVVAVDAGFLARPAALEVISVGAAASPDELLATPSVRVVVVANKVRLARSWAGFPVADSGFALRHHH